MLPDSLLLHRREGDVVRPRWLEAADAPWLEELLVRRDRAIGEPQVDLEEILLGDAPLPKRRLVANVLARLARPEAGRPGGIDPRQVRAAVFGAAAGAMPREQAIATAARTLGATPEDVESSLFADLPGERKVAPLPRAVSPDELRLRVNAALASGLLGRAVRVTVTTESDPLPLIRHARWTGLIEERGGAERRVGSPPGGRTADQGRIEERGGAERRVGSPPGGRTADQGRIAARGEGIVLSGPFALFRHTGLYGRALAGILPALQRVGGSFTAVVDLLLRGTPGRMTLDASSPVFVDGATAVPAASPAARLASAFLRIAPGWAAIADPEPLVFGDETLDADLLLVPPDGGPACRVELLRFWTSAHVRQRLERWERVGANVRLLLDSERNGGEEPPPEHPAVSVFRRQPNALTLLRSLA